MTSPLRIALSLLVATVGGAVVVLPGCGSSTPSDDCMAYYAADCDRVYTCTPEVALGGGFATDPDTCAARRGLFCPTLLDLPHTNLAGGYLGLCATDIAGATCDEWINQTFTRNACDAALRGTEPPEHACVDDTQCDSGYCIRPPSSITFGCGKCARLRITGQSCTDTFDTCDVGLSCNDGTCGSPKDLGERCSASELCAYSYVCGDEGRCTEPLTAGASCESDDQCNYAFGEGCDPESHTCGPLHPPFDGGQCYKPGSGLFFYCSPGFYCNVPPSGQKPGFCDATLADGTSCTVNGQDPCMPPATCDGTCALPTAATCH
ncbi:MAG TPA: hypothetical protein VGM56_25120 [Byssovorax sp.]|jgi:hypothetical protein